MMVPEISLGIRHITNKKCTVRFKRADIGTSSASIKIAYIVWFLVVERK